MIVNDGYMLTYYPKRNAIEIIMPQTQKTLTNTVSMVSSRKIDLTAEEQMMILSVVKAIMENER